MELKRSIVRRRRPTSCGRASSFATTRRSTSSCAEGWFKGVATLQMRSFDVFDGPKKTLDAWVLELAQPYHPLHAPTVCSAPAVRVHQSGGHGRVSSVTMVLQGRRPLPWLLVRAPAPWQARRTRAWRARGVVRARSSWHSFCDCCEERNFESMGGPWRPRLGFFGLLASV